MRVKFLLIKTLVISCLFFSNSFAEQPERDPQSTQIEEKDQKTPSLEFLEFLGQWETEDGRWIDPEDLDKISLPDPEQKDHEND